jgi:predicted nucleotidyltransferase
MKTISYNRIPERLSSRWRGLEECIRQIVLSLPVEQLVLFGSYGRGEGTDESDVDLCVVSPEADSQLKAARKIRKALWQVPACPPLTLIPITPERLREKLARHDPFFEDVVSTGIALLDED